MFTIQGILSLKNDFSGALKTAGGDAGAIALGILGNFDKIASGASDAFGLLTGDYSKLGDMLGSLPGPIGVVGGVLGNALGGILDDTINTAEGFRKLSQQTGVSVETLSGLTEVADDERVSADVLNASMLKLSRGLGGLEDPMDAATKGGKGLNATLADNGITARDSEGVFMQLADRVKELGPGEEATALATAVLGKQGAALIPVLLQGSAAIRENMASAKEMGLVYTQDTVDAVDQLKRSQDSLNDSFEGVKRQIGTAVVPALANATTGLNLYLEKANEIQQGNGNVFEKGWQALGNAVDFVTGKLKPAAEATEEAGGAASVAALRQLEYGKAAEGSVPPVEGLTESEKALKAQLDLVTGAITGQAAAMDDAERVQMAIKLATGQITEAQFETERATKAVMKALKDKSLTEGDAVKIIKRLTDGTLDARTAMKLAGPAADAFAGDVVGVETSARNATGPVGQLSTAINGVQSKNVTLSASAALAGNWGTYYDPNSGIYYSVKDGIATKTAYGARHNSFDDTKTYYDTHLTSADATKTAKGATDGTFTSTKNYYDTMNNGSALVTVSTTVTINYVPICFVAGTLIATPDATEAIETIQPGDQVLAYDHIANQRVVKTVISAFSHGPRETIIVTLGNGNTLECTPEHPFYVPAANDYVSAWEIEPGTLVYGIDGAPVEFVGWIWSGHAANVYNFHVSDTHNYYASGILVHNGTSRPEPPAPDDQTSPVLGASAPGGINMPVTINGASMRQVQAKLNAAARRARTLAGAGF